jgi:hypothetical protein
MVREIAGMQRERYRRRGRAGACVITDHRSISEVNVF